MSDRKRPTPRIQSGTSEIVGGCDPMDHEREGLGAGWRPSANRQPAPWPSHLTKGDQEGNDAARTSAHRVGGVSPVRNSFLTISGGRADERCSPRRRRAPNRVSRIRRRVSADQPGATPSRSRPTTMPSTRASHEASMTLAWTPIDPHAATPSEVSSKTRVVAPDASDESSTRTR